MIGRLPGMALGACLFVSVEAVSADLYWCDRCTPEQEKTMLARIDHGRTWSEVYVGDPSTRSLHKYGVARSWGQAVPYDVRRKGTEPEIESAFAQLLRFHDAAPAGWKKTYTLRIVDAARDASDYFNRQAIPVFDYPDPAVSVYDVLGDVRQRRFFDRRRTAAPLLRGLCAGGHPAQDSAGPGHHPPQPGLSAYGGRRAQSYSQRAGAIHGRQPGRGAAGDRRWPDGEDRRTQRPRCAGSRHIRAAAARRQRAAHVPGPGILRDGIRPVASIASANGRHRVRRGRLRRMRHA